MTSDRIELLGLRVYGRHGVLQAEAERGQTFVIDVVLHVDLAAAGRSDLLDDTVDYSHLAGRVHDLVANERYDLVETVAARVADVALSYSHVERVEVAVHKPDAPIDVPFGDVVVRIDRTR